MAYSLYACDTESLQEIHEILIVIEESLKTHFLKKSG